MTSTVLESLESIIMWWRKNSSAITGWLLFTLNSYSKIIKLKRNHLTKVPLYWSPCQVHISASGHPNNCTSKSSIFGPLSRTWLDVVRVISVVISCTRYRNAIYRIGPKIETVAQTSSSFLYNCASMVECQTTQFSNSILYMLDLSPNPQHTV